MSRKLNALATYLAEYEGLDDKDEISEGYDVNVYEYGGNEFLVLTDSQADKAVAERIEQDLWAFNATFLAEHLPIPQIAIKAIQDSMYETSSEVFRELLTQSQFDSLVEEAIMYDGRGHFLAQYDFAENEEGDYFIYKS